MPEYFITARSFAAPFVSDKTEKYVEGASPTRALQKFIKGYDHPCGLYAAEVWYSADDYHKHDVPADRWLSNAAQASQLNSNPKEGSFI